MKTILCAFVHKHKKTGELTSIKYQELAVSDSGFVCYRVKGIMNAYDIYPEYMFIDLKKDCLCQAYYDTRALPIRPPAFFQLKKELLQKKGQE